MYPAQTVHKFNWGRDGDPPVSSRPDGKPWIWLRPCSALGTSGRELARWLWRAGSPQQPPSLLPLLPFSAPDTCSFPPLLLLPCGRARPRLPGQLSVRSGPCVRAGFAECRRPAGGGAPPAQRGAAAAGPLLGNLPWAPRHCGARHSLAASPAAFARLFTRACRFQRHRAARPSSLPGATGGAEARGGGRAAAPAAPAAGRAGRCRRAGSALLPCLSALPQCLPCPASPGSPQRPPWRLWALPGYTERLEMFCVEVDAARSSSWRWRARSVALCPWLEGSLARLPCQSLTWAYVSDNWRGTVLFVGCVCSIRRQEAIKVESQSTSHSNLSVRSESLFMLLIQNF